MITVLREVTSVTGEMLRGPGTGILGELRVKFVSSSLACEICGVMGEEV